MKKKSLADAGTTQVYPMTKWRDGKWAEMEEDIRETCARKGFVVIKVFEILQTAPTWAQATVIIENPSGPSSDPPSNHPPENPPGLSEAPTGAIPLPTSSEDTAARRSAAARKAVATRRANQAAAMA